MKSVVELNVRSCLAPAIVLLTCVSTTAQTAKFHGVSAVQGFSQPARISDVACQLSGVVSSLEVTPGSQVQQGECLVRLDSSVHERRLEQARLAKESQGETRTAQANLAAQRSRLDRLTALRSRNHATDTELEMARRDFELAEASLLRAQENSLQFAAEYERLLAESQQYCIVAPFDGVLIEYQKQPGEYVGPVDPTVCVVADLSQLSVDFLVPRSLRNTIKLEQTVKVFFVEANRKVKGTVYFVSPFPHGETGTYTVKVLIDNLDRSLNAGERCTLETESSSGTTAGQTSP